MAAHRKTSSAPSNAASGEASVHPPELGKKTVRQLIAEHPGLVEAGPEKYATVFGIVPAHPPKTTILSRESEARSDDKPVVAKPGECSIIPDLPGIVRARPEEYLTAFAIIPGRL